MHVYDRPSAIRAKLTTSAGEERPVTPPDAERMEIYEKRSRVGFSRSRLVKRQAFVESAACNNN